MNKYFKMVDVAEIKIPNKEEKISDKEEEEEKEEEKEKKYLIK